MNLVDLEKCKKHVTIFRKVTYHFAALTFMRSTTSILVQDRLAIFVVSESMLFLLLFCVNVSGLSVTEGFDRQVRDIQSNQSALDWRLRVRREETQCSLERSEIDDAGRRGERPFKAERSC